MRKTVKMPTELLADLIGHVHSRTKEGYHRAEELDSKGHHDLAASVRRRAEQTRGEENRARALMQLPPCEPSDYF